MSEFKGTPHNSARLGDIAKTVLMPGDPLRAKFIAEHFLDNAKEFNHVRGMLGYTGTFKGHPVSVMGSGMGIPSMGIYSYELFAFYGVENIIRIGTTGGMDPSLDLFDVVLVDGSYSKSTYAKVAFNFEEDLMKPSSEIVDILEETAKAIGKPYRKGIVDSGDVFYSDNSFANTKYQILAGEMESFALFANARRLGKRAACLLTVSDLICEGKEHKETTAEERQTAFTDMMEIALNTAIKL